MTAIEVKGKKKDVEMLADGVAMTTTRNGTKQYYIRCNVLGTWDFRHEKAFSGLLKKYGSIEEVGKNVISNAGKKANNGDISAVKVEVSKDKGVEIEIDSMRGKREFGKDYWSAGGEAGTWREVEY